MENEETEKEQLDEVLKLVGDKLRKKSKEYTEFKKIKTTETPRTNAIEFRHCPPHAEAMLKKHEDAYALCRQLERELSVEIANRKKCCLDGNKISDELFDAGQKLKKAEAEVESLNSRMVELKHLQASLIAAINTAITESPSNQASIYLSGIMEKLFQK